MPQWMIVYFDEGNQMKWVESATYQLQAGEAWFANYATESELDDAFPNRPIRRAIQNLDGVVRDYVQQAQTPDLVRRAILNDSNALEDLQDIQDYVDTKAAERAALEAQLV